MCQAAGGTQAAAMVGLYQSSRAMATQYKVFFMYASIARKAGFPSIR
jgi:hypothetical protein